MLLTKLAPLAAASLALTLTSAAPALAAASVTAGDAQNKAAITLHPGDSLHVVLKSTAWTIDPAHGRALATRGEQVVAVTRPGPGAPGTTSRSFAAVALGDATVTASRTTCGEALRCTPAQSAYRLTVHVVAVPTLPRTGVPVGAAVLLGGLLIGVGTAALLLARSRSRWT